MKWLKNLLRNQTTYAVTNIVAIFFVFISVASILDTTGPITGLVHIAVCIIALSYIYFSFRFGVEVAYILCMATYIPVFLLNSMMIGDKHGHLVYLFVFLIGSIVTVRAKYSIYISIVFVFILTTVYVFHGNLGFFPETNLSVVADPASKIFGFTKPDPDTSIFHYQGSVAISGWKFTNYLLVGMGVFSVLLAYKIQLTNARIEISALLSNILPPSIVDRMGGRTSPNEIIADGHEDVALLIADIVDSTALSATMNPHELVTILNTIFAEFDDITDSYKLEKIKTMGDGYFVAGGAPDFVENHLEATVRCAISMRSALRRLVKEGAVPHIEIRIGIHAGPVVAGVIGKRKFAYDLWGDAVNLASRLESTGISGEIQVSEAVHDRLSDRFQFTERGFVEMKGKGSVKTYILKGNDD